MTGRSTILLRNAALRQARPWWLLGALALGVAGLGCAGDGPLDGGGVPPLRAAGADVSALAAFEGAGAHYRDGTIAGALPALHARGSTLFRLRLFVAPLGTGIEVNDLPYTIALAQRIKATGAGLLLDIHYSDTWADPAHQAIPAAWAGLTLDSLEQVVEAYTTAVLRAMDSAGVRPDIVQVGNEIDSGFLWPLGHVGGSDDTPAQWAQFGRLLAAGIRGVRAATPPGDTIRVLLHYSGGGNPPGIDWFFGHVAQLELDYDLIGLSWYPWWHGSLSALRAGLATAANHYGRDVMVVETAYPWRHGAWEQMIVDSSALAWPMTRAGQARFLADLVAAVRATPGGRGAGVLWWHPEAIPAPGLFVWGDGALALFDSTGALLPAARAFAP